MFYLLTNTLMTKTIQLDESLSKSKKLPSNKDDENLSKSNKKRPPTFNKEVELKLRELEQTHPWFNSKQSAKDGNKLPPMFDKEVEAKITEMGKTHPWFS